MLIRPLPYRDSSRLAMLSEYNRGREPGSSDFGFNQAASAADFLDWKREAKTFEALEALTWGFFDLTGDHATEVMGGRVTTGFFSTLGVAPLLGRTLLPRDENEHVAVLGHALWQSQFGGEPNVIGRTVAINREPYTVIGVLPQSFYFYLRDFELWTPLALNLQQKNDRNTRRYLAVGRLKRGASLPDAKAELTVIADRLEHAYPASNKDTVVSAVSLRDQFSRPFRTTLLVLLGAVTLLLLIGCANVASLLLAHATSREKEMAIRRALGASRWNIVRLLLGESLAISLLASALGIIAAFWIAPALKRLLPAKLPIALPGLDNIGVNLPVLGFALALSALTAAVFGLYPAWRSSRASLNSKGVSAAPEAVRFLNLIVIGEVAVSMVLLAGAGVMIKSFWRLLNQDYGFRPDHVLYFRTPLPKGTGQGQAARFFAEVVEQAARLPGVESAAAVYSLPLSGERLNGFEIEGRMLERGKAPRAATNVVSPNYFRTMQIPLRSGRDFTAADNDNSAPVAIVSEIVARRWWPGQSPMGRRIHILDGPNAEWRTIVGVAGDVRPWVGGDFGPMIYTPLSQDPPGSVGYVLRTIADPMRLASAAQSAVWAINKDQPVTYISTFESDVREFSYPQRLNSIGLGWFAAIGLVFASAGMYGLIWYSVRQRRSEIGIRMALGAQTHNVTLLVLRQGLLLTGAGILLGLGGALAAMRVLKAFLYRTDPMDLPTLAGLAAILGFVAALASYFPARKAAQVDPMTVLRNE